MAVTIGAHDPNIKAKVYVPAGDVVSGPVPAYKVKPPKQPTLPESSDVDMCHTPPSHQISACQVSPAAPTQLPEYEQEEPDPKNGPAVKVTAPNDPTSQHGLKSKLVIVTKIEPVYGHDGQPLQHPQQFLKKSLQLDGESLSAIITDCFFAAICLRICL